MFKNKVFITIISFYILYLVFLPLVLTKTVVPFCKNITKNSEYIVEINNPKIKTFVLPKICLKFDQIYIKNKNTNNFVTAKNLKISLRLLPLITKRIHINNFEIDDLNLSTNLNKEFVLEKNLDQKIKNSKIKCNNLKINKCEAKFYQKDIKQPMKYIGENILYVHNNRYIKIYLNSNFIVNNNISSVKLNLTLPKNNDINKTNFDIEISNPDISRLKNYFKNYLPNDLKTINGAINISANKGKLIANLNNIAIIMDDNIKSIILPKETIIKSNFFINQSFITLESLAIESKNINLNINGKIYDYFGKTMPSLDLKVMINKSQIQDIIKLLPAFNIEELNAYKLKYYKIQGEILANIKIKGRLPEPDVEGDAILSGLFINKAIPNTKNGGIVKLNFKNKLIKIFANVPTGYSEKVIVKGSQELYNYKISNLNITSTQNVDLNIAREILNPLHEILNFIIGPLPIINISGKGNIDITVKGNRKNPHIWGVLNLKNISTNLLEAPGYRLTETDAILNFNNQEVLFNILKSKLNNKDFKMNGVSDLFGKFDFKLKSSNQQTLDLYNGVITSHLISDFKKMFPNLNNIEGITDFDLTIYGNVKSLNEIKVNENVFLKGVLYLKDNKFTIENIPITKTNVNIKLDGLNADVIATAAINDSMINLIGKIKNNIADIKLDIPRFNPNYLILDKMIKNKQYLPIITISANYKGPSEKLDYEKLNFKSKIIETHNNSEIKYSPNGEITLENNKLNLKNISGYLINAENTFSLDLKINNTFSKDPLFNGFISLNTPNISNFNEVFQGNLFPPTFQKYIQNYEFNEGNINLNCKIINNKTNMFLDLAGLKFKYLPIELPVDIINGTLLFKNGNLKLNKINFKADSMPFIIDGEIKDLTTKPWFNLYLNTKPQQDFIDKYINKNQVYPIKIKGDIVLLTKIKGFIDNYDLKSQINIERDASIYHYGAIIGDIENAISLVLDSKFVNNTLKIKEFSYDKLINSQNNKISELNLLKTKGDVTFLKDDLEFENLNIKTNYPTDARIFNIIFRKPNIKQGQFTSDLKLNGKLSSPKIIGDFHIFETDIPFLDTTMKNIELIFKDKVVEIKSKGEVLSNDLIFTGILKNKLTKPYVLEKGLFVTKNLNLNHIVNLIKTSEMNDVSTFDTFDSFDINSVIFKNLTLKADNIELRNIHATNFVATTEFDKNGVLNVDKFKFNIAQGLLSGKYEYNTKNNNLALILNATEIDANDISYALFNLNNQIYGDLTGTINFNCEGTDFNRCLETITGNSNFNVKNGKMPKLGSLEYLLKASNLVKSGITGLSINNVIDLITPQKTGEFSSINGAVRMKDGAARSIEIMTKGKDLNLFLVGTYNFATSIADMEVYGLLSRKISNLFGPIGNLSLNTLFNLIPGIDLENENDILTNINKIPGIELSNKNYRRFLAIIKGNINGDDYVTSFKWVN